MYMLTAVAGFTLLPLKLIYDTTHETIFYYEVSATELATEKWLGISIVENINLTEVWWPMLPVSIINESLENHSFAWRTVWSSDACNVCVCMITGLWTLTKDKALKRWDSLRVVVNCYSSTPSPGMYPSD